MSKVRAERIINDRKIVEDFARFRIGQTLIVPATKRKQMFGSGDDWDKGTVKEIKVTEHGYSYLIRFDSYNYGEAFQVKSIDYTYIWFPEEKLDFHPRSMDGYQEAKCRVPIIVEITNYHRADAGFSNREWEIVRDYAKANAVQMLRVVGNDQGWYPYIQNEDDERIIKGETITPAFRASYYSVEIGMRSVILKVYAYKDMFEHNEEKWCKENPQHTDKGKFRYPKDYHRKN